MPRPPLTSIEQDFQTPAHAVNPLIPYLKKGWVIWECANGQGNLSNALIKNNFSVIKSDILTGFDFLSDAPLDCDCIITNPPYNKKDKFLQRCYEISRPFALLLPLYCLESEPRYQLFRDFGLELILMPRRIHYINPKGISSRSWYPSAWFTNWLNIGTQITYPG